MLVPLGATAAQALLGRSFKVTQRRGEPIEGTRLAEYVVATVHPSSILRAPDEEARRRGRLELAADLTVVGELLVRERGAYGQYDRAFSTGKRCRMGKSVKDAMTSAVKTATPSQSLTDAARLMKQEDVGSVPVVDGERLIGMLTDRDIVVRGIADGSDPHAIKVGDIASRDLVTVKPDDDLDDALRLMAQHQVRRLPVVEDGQLVGVVATADVAHEAKEKALGHVMEEISKP